MYQVDFNHPVHIYFIGIGGISMSGLAEILLSEGFRVSGSDAKKSSLTELLEKQGAVVHYGQCRENITNDIDLVVYTAAIHKDNPEFAAMEELGLPSLTRAQLLGQMMRNYKTPIGVSGTHGKTTTTSRDLDDIRSSFRCFAQLLPEDGLLIISGDISDYEEITRGLSCSVLTFGSDSSCDYYYDGISHDEFAHASFTLHRRGGSDIPVSLGVPGEHNILNALAALALADYLKLDMETAARALKNFTGTDRRFEYKGSVEGITIVDDYAHHPTEITATLKAARNYPHQTLWCVFQPHTYTRTKAFLPEFAQALSLADKVILADIYPARETDTLGISSMALQEIIVNSGTECHYFPSFEEIQKFILENCTPGDLLITMGAGDVVNIGENLLKQ